MPLQIKDRISVIITIADKELWLDNLNVLEVLHISCSTKLSLPMLYIRYRDGVEWVGRQKLLFDGSPIEVSISRGQEPAKVYSFVLNSYKERQDSGQLVYQIDAYAAFPKYWNNSTQESIKGSASTALSFLADTCGFKNVEIESTSDSQVWYPRNRRLHEWARDIGRRGYEGDEGCFQLAVDADGTFRYWDLMKRRSATTEFGLSTLQPGVVLVTDYKPRSASALLNKQNGYGAMRIEQKPLEISPFRIHEHISVPAPSGSLMMSGRIKSEVDRGRIQFAPIDPGNVNENFERGLYQNERARGLFSVGMDILTPFVTETKLLDRVSLIVPKEIEYLKAYSTEYVVVSRAIIVQGIDYFEKFELATTGLNDSFSDVADEATGPLYTDNSFLDGGL